MALIGEIGDTRGKFFSARYRPALHIDRLKLLENGLDTIGFMLELAAMGIEPGISPALVFRATPDDIGCIGEISAGMVKIGDLMLDMWCPSRALRRRVQWSSIIGRMTALEITDKSSNKSPSLWHNYRLACGEVAEWLMAADCKSALLRVRWFESSPLHQ